MSQGVIELNGKRYDAYSGAFLGKSEGAAVPAVRSRGHSIDGFMRPSTRAAHLVKLAPKPAKAQPAKPAQLQHPQAVQTANVQTHPPKKARTVSGVHMPAHRPQSAKTLMRRVVQKPKHQLKTPIKVQTAAEVMAKPPSALVRKHSAMQVDASRQNRAVQTPKHGHVARFHASHHTPTVAPPRQQAAQISHLAVRPTPHTAHATRPAHAPAKPTHHDMFEAAIARATSHQQPHHKPRKKHRRLANALAIVGTFLVIGGFVGYLNLPGLEMRIASMQAGFAASLPTYTPTGYALEDGAERSGNTIRLGFRSGDSRYTITQQASDWNSQTLLDNTLALSGPHDVVQKNGQTIYIYGEGANASWVTGGVRYDIAGNAQLSKDEITAIATSM